VGLVPVVEVPTNASGRAEGTSDVVTLNADRLPGEEALLDHGRPFEFIGLALILGGSGRGARPPEKRADAGLDFLGT